MVQEPQFFSKQVTTAHRFYRNPQGAVSQDFSVIAGGKETCPPGYQIHRNSFLYYGIELVVSGKGSLMLGNQTYELTPGTLFCYGPDIAHTIENNQQETDLIKYFVDLKGDAVQALLNEIALPGKVFHTSSPRSLMNSFEELSLYGLSDTRFAELLCASLGKSLIYKIAQTAIPYGEPYTTSFSTFTRCKDLLDSKYLSLHTLQDIAEACGIDGAYLCRLFKKYEHQSPYQYLLRLQMNYAADLLSTCGLQVKETAARLSYEDQYHFSRTFKRIMGQAPNTYSKQRSN